MFFYLLLIVIFDFEPVENGQILDSPEFRQIHEEYKNLVDVMLSSFMEDLGIAPEQLESACLDSREYKNDAIPHPFHRRLFEQIWAANDYGKFVKMMIRRNVELQLQALDLIGKKSNSLPEHHPSLTDSSRQTSEEAAASVDTLEADHYESEVTNSYGALDPDEDDVFHSSQVEEERKVLAKKLEHLEISEDPDHSGTASKVESNKKKDISETDIEQRKEYLKKQRDKLVALKKQARGKQLDRDQQRVKSSKTARRFINGEDIGTTSAHPSEQISSSRMALVKRLKDEVVNLG